MRRILFFILSLFILSAAVPPGESQGFDTKVEISELSDPSDCSLEIENPTVDYAFVALDHESSLSASQFLDELSYNLEMSGFCSAANSFELAVEQIPNDYTITCDAIISIDRTGIGKPGTNVSSLGTQISKTQRALCSILNHLDVGGPIVCYGIDIGHLNHSKHS